MIKTLATAAAASLLTCAAAAQTSELRPQTRTTVTPIVPPATAVTRIAPGTFVVTPVPGIAAATKVKIQEFGDYDLNGDGVYAPMEFAQAMYFLATSDPVAGNPELPSWDRYTHRGAAQQMDADDAVDLLNATADEFVIVDINNDWRIQPAELAAFALL